MPNKRQFVSTAYMSIAILTSGYALTTTKFSLAIYLMCAFGLAIFLVRTSDRQGQIPRFKIKTTLLLLSSILIPATLSLIANPSTENSISFFKLSLSILFGAVIFLSYEAREFQRAFSNTILFISAISIPGYALANYTDILASLPAIPNTNEVTYRFAFIFLSFDGFLQYRNIGVFWEPGIFASMIFCALVADLYHQDKISTTRTSIFLIALATTFSGAAAILFAVYLTLTLTHPNKDANQPLSKRIQPIVLALGVAVAFLWYATVTQPETLGLLERLAGKLIDPEDTQATRFLSPIISLQVFLEKPILGWGLTGAVNEYTSLNDEIALTSTSTYLMSAIGIFGSLLTLIPIIGLAKLTELSRFARAILALAYMFIINKEPHAYFSVTYAIMFFLLAAALRSINKRSRVPTAPAT